MITMILLILAWYLVGFCSFLGICLFRFKEITSEDVGAAFVCAICGGIVFIPFLGVLIGYLLERKSPNKVLFRIK